MYRYEEWSQNFIKFGKSKPIKINYDLKMYY